MQSNDNNKNRGAHGDSSFMLSEVSLSSENLSGFSRGECQMAKARKAAGDKLILWTCREGPELDAAIEACREQGLEFDAVNDNLPELKKKWGDNPRKVAADEYWDDKNFPLKPLFEWYMDQAVRRIIEQSGRVKENDGV